jgi:hypothetical protein
LFERRIQTAMKTARPVESPLQITLIRSGILRVLPDEWVLRELGERDLQTVHDAPGDFILYREHIRRAAVVPFGPEMAPVFGADQLRGDSQTVSGFPNRALQHRIDVEEPANASDVGHSLLDVNGRCSRGHTKSRHLAQSGQELLRKPVAEVLEVLVGSEILEREHGDRRDTTAAAGGDVVRNRLVQRVLEFEHAHEIVFHHSCAAIPPCRIARQRAFDDLHQTRW